MNLLEGIFVAVICIFIIIFIIRFLFDTAVASEELVTKGIEFTDPTVLGKKIVVVSVIERKTGEPKRIRLITKQNGVFGVRHDGTFADFSKAEAKELISVLNEAVNKT